MRDKIVMTGGGTAGHVMVNTVLIPRLIAMGWEVVYIGSHDGVEKQMIGELQGVTYYSIATGKLRRYMTLKHFGDGLRVLKGTYEAYRLLRKLKPNMIFSCGGFVVVPVVIGGWLNRIPSVLRETDYTVGLANRICIPFARQVCTTFPDTLKGQLPNIKRLQAGPIIRPSLLEGDKGKALELTGLEGRKPVVLVQGGSQGAYRINTVVREALKDLLRDFDISHLCGKGNINLILQTKGYVQYEYVKEELAHLYAVADLVITRAGSNAVFEGMSTGKPMILLPIGKKVSRGDQILNARYVERHGMGRVILDEVLTPEILVRQVQSVYAMRERFANAHYRKSNDRHIQNQISVIAAYKRE